MDHTFYIINEFKNRPDYLNLVEQLNESLKNEQTETFIPQLSLRWKNYGENTKKIIDSLCKIIVSYLEKNFYKQKIKIIDLKILKHLINTSGKKDGAFLWHTDNHSPEILNIIVYLDDVDEDNGPMQYCTYNNNIIKFDFEQEPYGGKIKEDFFIQNKDMQIHSIIGEKATTFIFDNCILHRASIPLQRERNAILLQVMPNI